MYSIDPKNAITNMVITEALVEILSVPFSTIVCDLALGSSISPHSGFVPTHSVSLQIKSKLCPSLHVYLAAKLPLITNKVCSEFRI